MPRGDRTGPQGLGPKTGRAAGYCTGYPNPGFMNPLPRYGRGYGAGRGWRRGGRRGFGRGWSGDFRESWWNPPQYQHSYPLLRFPPRTYAQSPEQETAALEHHKKELEAERTDLEHEVKDIEARIQELKTKREQSASQ